MESSKGPGFFVGMSTNENLLKVFALRTNRVETLTRQAITFRRSFDFHKSIRKRLVITHHTLIQKQENDKNTVPKNLEECYQDPEFYQAIIKEKK